MGLSDRLRKQLGKMPATKTWKLRPDVLLCPNVPKPMHGVAPRVVLGSKWWNKTRKEAYASTDFHCIACGVAKHLARGRKWLEGHEIYTVNYTLGRMVYVETVPLCHFCHNYIHDGRMQMLVQKRLMHQGKYVEIIQHGDMVLRMAGLARPTHSERDASVAKLAANGKVAAWCKWRLVLNGKLYPPKYKSMEEWLMAMDTTE